MSWRSFCQRLIFFTAVTALVLGLVVGTGAQVSVALGAAAAIGVVVKDMAGSSSEPARRARRNTDKALGQARMNMAAQEQGEEP